jgi:hypothetical protein
MIKLVGFDSGKLSSKLCKDEFVGSISITVVEDDGVTKVHGVGLMVKDRENVSDLGFGSIVNVLAEKNGGLVEVGGLTAKRAEGIKDIANVGSLLHQGRAA